MNWFNHEWLGFAQTPLEAVRIIKFTGFFYILISVVYLVSFLYMHWNISAVSLPNRKKHLYAVAGWAGMGCGLIFLPLYTGFIFNLAVIILCVLQFYYLQFFHALIIDQSLKTAFPPQTEDKKVMYALNLIGKAQLTLKDLSGYSLLNERILWMIILYKASIALRASLVLVVVC